jgi:hypothetical protein
VAALEYLNELPRDPIQKQTAVLASPMLSNYVPRYAGRIVFAGHWGETLYYYDIKTGKGKWADVKRFFGQRGHMSEKEALWWLQKNRIGIIIFGEYEQRLGASLPFALPVIKEFPGVNGLPATVLFDATAAYRGRVN